jgi:hypothetical protein
MGGVLPQMPRLAVCCLAPLVMALCVGCSVLSRSNRPAAALPLPGHAQVAHLPHHDGLQYCVRVRPGDLAPAGSRNVFIHSLSAYITSADKNTPALVAIRGRYPGWDTPGTTVYEQPFTNTNTVWVEIDHSFPLGVACIEVYGTLLEPSSYARFAHQMLVGYTYLHAAHGWRTDKLFRVHWGAYLPRYSPRARPKR